MAVLERAGVTASIALIGVGPRSVAVAARLVADHETLAPDVRLRVHLIDPVDIGAGRTWRRDQNRLLLNNTYSGETTVFADATVPTAGPTCPGPSLDQWAGLVLGDPQAFDGWVVAEARTTSPGSFPSRAFQGCYLRWALDRVIRSAPALIDFCEHRAAVTGLSGHAGERQRLRLSDGDVLEADVVVLAQGLLTSDHAPETVSLSRQAADRGLRYLSPGMPTERAWDEVPAEPVLVRGLGANFFDALGLLFEGRGGRFRRAADGELRYRASGREPTVVAGSRHGLPYRAKAYYAGRLPEPVELPRVSAAREQQLISEHGGRADIDYSAELAADVAADLSDVYASVVAAGGGSAVGPLDWTSLVFPAGGRSFAGERDWTEFLDHHLTAELSRIRHPDGDPEKAVHRAVETLRRRLSRLVLAQVFTPISVQRDLKQGLLPQALVLASGPPPRRLEELLALRRAGLVEIIGPGLRIDVAPDAFVARTAVPGQVRSARVLAEARMSLGDLRTTDDPLINSLLGAGQARFHRVPQTDGGGWFETATLDVTSDRFLMIDAAGRAHPRRIVLGSPAGDVQWNAALGAIPHTSDKLLVGAERAAAYALVLVAGGPVGDLVGESSADRA